MNLDFSKLKSLNIEGIDLINLYITEYRNRIPTSIDTDGSIFNGSGYITNYRLNSSGTTTFQTGTVTTGFIPCKATDVIRLAGVDVRPTTSGYYCYLSFYDSNFACLGSQSNSWNENYPTGQTLYRGIVVTNDANNSNSNLNIPSTVNGVTTFDNYTFSANSGNVAYFRINGHGNGADMVVTLNEEIVNLNPPPIWAKYIYTNWVSKSTESDGVTIYNGGLGYKDGYRIRSGGAEGSANNATCTGFIPVSGGDIIRLSGMDFDFATTGNAINLSDKNFSNIGQLTSQPAAYGILGSSYSEYNYSSVVKESDTVWKWTVPPAASGVAYIRVTGSISNKCPSDSMIVTVNEEIPF